MKVFVVTSIIGQDANNAAALLGRACSSLSQAGHNPTHNLSEIQFLQENQISAADAMRRAYSGIDSCEGILCIIQPGITNDDALAAFGYAWAKGKKLLLAFPASTNSPLAALADVAIRYTDVADLSTKLSGLHR
jgi:nucleoside 2-deoxyribosyltransferase